MLCEFTHVTRDQYGQHFNRNTRHLVSKAATGTNYLPYAQQPHPGEQFYNKPYGMLHYIMDVQENTGILMPMDCGRREGEMFLKHIATDKPTVWTGSRILRRAGNSVPPQRIWPRPAVTDEMLPERGPLPDRHGPRRPRSWTRGMYPHRNED